MHLRAAFCSTAAMFNCGALYIEAQGGNKDSLACTSLGISFILFLAIIVYHVWRRLQTLIQKKRRQNTRITSGKDNVTTDSVSQDQSSHSGVTYQLVSVSDGSQRESLLESLM